MESSSWGIFNDSASFRLWQQEGSGCTAGCDDQDEYHDGIDAEMVGVPAQ